LEIAGNAAKNTFGNMYEEGVVDPAKVTRSGLQKMHQIASKDFNYRVYY
jgi:chaperonin GroEL (HSP60 family)